MKIGVSSTADIVVNLLRANSEIANPVTFEAVYARTIGEAEEFASKHGISKAYDDYELFVNSDIDAVYVATPNAIHYEQAARAIKANKHVLIEKPMCINPEQINSLYALAKEHNVFIMEALTTQSNPIYRILKNQLNDLSQVVFAEFTMMQQTRHYQAYVVGEYRNVFDLKMGGGAFYDLGVYLVYPAIELFGIPQNVTYFPQRNSLQADLTTTVILEYPNFNVSLNVSKICFDPRPCIIATTSNTYTMSSFGDLKDFQVYDTKGNLLNEYHREAHNMSFELKHFQDIIVSGHFVSDIYTKEKALAVNEILYGLHKNINL